ncbi:MAG: hypothetical protein FAF04_08660, partial [Epsilonproteobacteria bacterium]|nr:hypothetical protein [Campylobacterota bacterium]
PKFITKKNSDNVIFKFKIDGKIVRKWVNKDEILLLTDNKEFYLKTMQNFQKVEEEQQKLVTEAQEKLNETIENYAQTMNEEFDSFEEMRENDDIPCILKDL